MAETTIDVDPPQSVAVATTRSIELSQVATRSEHDLLGDTDVPSDAYWGVHTLRAVDNFPITGVPVGHFPDLVRALALVKQAAARANRRLGHLAPAKADAIDPAWDHFRGRAADRFARRACLRFQVEGRRVRRCPQDRANAASRRGADDARPGVRRLFCNDQGRRRPIERGRGAVSRG